MQSEAVQWILLLMPSLALVVLGFYFWHSTTPTRARSATRSGAVTVWQSEVDAQLADIESRVAGLSSTLRKLHGRESQRSRRDSPEPSPETDKLALRRKYGIVPGPTRAD